ncbi:oligopeptide:H+ symporter [Kocuria carniphila]|uniref:oligopeptide:H+ symporter n=1 Tax=Kocuria carniphila TaxID=262208 RepID=UPI003621AEDF
MILAAIAIFTMLLRDRDLSSDEHSRVISFIPMFIATAAFFALFQQQFTVIAIYADTRLNLNLFGGKCRRPGSSRSHPVFIILLAPVFAAMWTKLGRRQPTTPVKFGLALLLIGAAFLTFLPMVGHVSVPLMWIALILLIATLGELMLSPVGLSLTTKLAPNKYPAQMVALNNLAVSLGTTLSGVLAVYYTSDTEGAYFGTLGLITAALGVVLLLLPSPSRASCAAFGKYSTDDVAPAVPNAPHLFREARGVLHPTSAVVAGRPVVAVKNRVSSGKRQAYRNHFYRP